MIENTQNTSSRFYVPVLLYHSISDSPGDRICVAREVFESHMKLLSEEFRPLTLSDAVDHLRTNTPLPPRSVAVTFDDGYEDNYWAATRVLDRFAIRATIFICPTYIGQRNDWNTRAYTRRSHLAARQIKDLISLGHEIGSHGIDHHYLRKLEDDELIKTIHGSKLELEQQFDQTVRFFAYPYGDDDPRALYLLQENYELAFATDRTGFPYWDEAPYNIGRHVMVASVSVSQLRDILHKRSDGVSGHRNC